MNSTPTPVPPAAPWLAHLRRESERFAEVVGQAPLRAHVPAYPDFTVHSLAAHIGRALRLFQGIVTTDNAVGDGAGYQSVEIPEGREIADWVLAGVDPLVTLLSEVPPDKPVLFPHQTGDRPAGLIAPLLAVEVGVHRWDVESVLGEHAPIPSDLAVQEVESVFANFVPRLAGSGVTDIGGTVWLRTTDTEATWSARVNDGRLVTKRAPGGPRDTNGPHETAVVATGAAQDIAHPGRAGELDARRPGSLLRRVFRSEIYRVLSHGRNAARLGEQGSAGRAGGRGRGFPGARPG